MKKTERINHIIDGYISELKSNNISSFYYNGENVQIYKDELSNDEYMLVNFIGDLLCIRYDTWANWCNYDIKIAIKNAEKEYDDIILKYDFLSSAIDSLYMMIENDE